MGRRTTFRSLRRGNALLLIGRRDHGALDLVRAVLVPSEHIRQIQRLLDWRIAWQIACDYQAEFALRLTVQAVLKIKPFKSNRMAIVIAPCCDVHLPPPAAVLAIPASGIGRRFAPLIRHEG